MKLLIAATRFYRRLLIAPLIVYKISSICYRESPEMNIAIDLHKIDRNYPSL